MHRVLASFVVMVCAALPASAGILASDYWTALSGEEVTKALPAGAVPAMVKSPFVRHRVYRANRDRLESALAQAPKEGEPSELFLPVPRADGGFETVLVNQHSIAAPGLEAKYPHIRSYRGTDRAKGVSAALGFNFKTKVFHGMLLFGDQNKVIIDPIPGTPDLYLAIQKLRGS